MAINADDVKRLRRKTGAGIMDCKRALKESNGDFGRAEEILKELGLAAVAKLSGRAAKEGRVFAYVGENSAGLMEINCETDFVARNASFIRAGNDLVKTAVENSLTMQDAACTDIISELAATLKENIALGRMETIKIADNQLAFRYIHGDSGNPGVLIVLELSPMKKDEAVLTLGKDLAMHAAAFNPLYLNPEAVDASYMKDQEKIFRTQAEQMDKPPNVTEGIIKGKMRKHLKEICFTEQGFVKDEKRSVAQVLKDTSKDVGVEITLTYYRVFRVGESLSEWGE
ncbi:MAG: translation elongation factor Ts [Salinispira sp.]